MPLQHIECKCGFKLVCPWDRYCAGCGESLTGPHGEQVTIPDTVKVGSESKIAFNIFNKSQVPINIVIPHIAPSPQHAPPRWLKYNAATGNQQAFALTPNGYKTISFDVDQKVIEEMLRAPHHGPQGGPTATVFKLKVMLDADYRRQLHEVTISLLGQADLRPAAIEFPAIWITNPGKIELPFRIFNASGEDMTVLQFMFHTPNQQDNEIVEALFPMKKFTVFSGQNVPAGKHTDVFIESIPLDEALRKLTEQKGPRFQDPYAERRRKLWLEKWPALTRLRFVLEATLQSSRGDPVPTVRSLVVITLVRPPLLRDRSPEDELWKPTLSPASHDHLRQDRGVHHVKDNSASELIADLTNDSAIPVLLTRVSVDRPWVEILSSPMGQILGPGANFLIRVRLDMSRRDPSEMRSGLLSARVTVATSPPTPLGELDTITVRTNATVVLPGCLGIDFGTSNCAACYMPAGEPPPEYSELSSDPVPLFLESGTTQNLTPNENLSSVLVRRLALAPHQPDPEFAFGVDVEEEALRAPDNVIRGIKRMLSQNPNTIYHLRTSEPSKPVIQYTTLDIAARVLRHLVSQAQALAPQSQELRKRLVDSAERHRDPTHPTPEDIREATAFRFAKAVFTHPVDAPESLKRILYQCALVTDMANEYPPRGEPRQLSYEEFCAQRLVDESTAAITHFVSRNSQLMTAPRKYRILCIDIGGGTTDISAMMYNPITRIEAGEGSERKVERRKTLTLCYRKGIHDFAGIDLDRAIVLKLILPSANEKLSATGKGRIAIDLVDNVLQGYATDVLLTQVSGILPSNSSPDTINRLYQSIVRTTTSIRNRAEELKKFAGMNQRAEASVTIPRHSVLVLPNGQLGELSEELVVSINLMDINHLIRDMLRIRLPVLDEIVSKVCWGWEKVDILMFTGQSSRSPIIRETVMNHVCRQRKTPLPTLVVPNIATETTSGMARQVIEFDPKRCVPSGAALRGHGGRANNHIHMSTAPLGALQVESDGQIIRPGDPLPAFLPAHTFDTGALNSEVILEIDGHQKIVDVPFPPDTPLTILFHESGKLYLLQTTPEGPPDPELPEQLNNILNEIPLELYEKTGISGPIISWCQLIQAI